LKRKRGIWQKRRTEIVDDSPPNEQPNSSDDANVPKKPRKPLMNLDARIRLRLRENARKLAEMDRAKTNGHGKHPSEG